MEIRAATPADVMEWARLRNELWPDSIDVHLADITPFFSGAAHGIQEVFIIDGPHGRLGGFIELNIRGYAEGSAADQVPYIEGWFVAEELRGQGWGRRLVDAAEQWAQAQGFTELASDAELDNAGSIAAHEALGFEETDRIVCFLKKLPPE